MIRYILTLPLFIGSRLMPAVKVAPKTNAEGVISAEISKIRINSAGIREALIHYAIDMPGGHSYEKTDLTIRAFEHDERPEDVIRRAFGSLCGYLTLEAESYAGSANMGANEPCGGWLFEPKVAEWAYLNSGELAMIGMEMRNEDGE